MSKEQVFRVGTNPKMRCTCGMCGKRAANTPAEFPVEANLEAALAAPKARMLSGVDRAAAIAKQNESPAITDHAVRMGRDGKYRRNGVELKPTDDFFAPKETK